MKIAVNTRLLLKGQMDGIGWFTYENFKRITRNHPEHEFHFLFDRPFSSEFIFSDNVIPHVVPPQARHPWLFRIWYDYTVPRKLKEIGADLFISPDMMMSLRTDIPQIVTLHDLNFEHYPKDLPKIVSNYLRRNTPKFVKKAKRIVTVSEFSKSDIASIYGVSPGKIDVVYNGAGENYHPVDVGTKFTTRHKLTDGSPYFVFVSSIHPRKNLQRLLPAFELFKERSRSDVRLVIVGKSFWKNPELDEIFENMKFRHSVTFTGRLESSELNDVVGSALASTYVSYFEGFGIPIVESFRCEVPVITSNVTAMPEVAGNAALYADPFSVESIADALMKMWKDESLRNDLIAKGNERVKEFSWDKSAEALWKVIENSLH